MHKIAVVHARVLAMVCATLLLFGAFAPAQDQKPADVKPFELPKLELPKNEVFVGYAHQYADLNGVVSGAFGPITTNTLPGVAGFPFELGSTGINGVAFEFSHYFHKKLGFTIDLARESNNKVSSTGIGYERISYLAGPTYRLRSYGLFCPSVHVLAGVDHSELTDDESLPAKFTFIDTQFGAAAGATLDGNLSRHLAIRIAQLDYVYSHHYSANQNSFRYTGGVVLRF